MHGKQKRPAVIAGITFFFAGLLVVWFGVNVRPPPEQNSAQTTVPSAETLEAAVFRAVSAALPGHGSDGARSSEGQTDESSRVVEDRDLDPAALAMPGLLTQAPGSGTPDPYAVNTLAPVLVPAVSVTSKPVTPLKVDIELVDDHNF